MSEFAPGLSATESKRKVSIQSVIKDMQLSIIIYYPHSNNSKGKQNDDLFTCKKGPLHSLVI